MMRTRVAYQQDHNVQIRLETSLLRRAGEGDTRFSSFHVGCMTITQANV